MPGASYGAISGTNGVPFSRPRSTGKLHGFRRAAAGVGLLLIIGAIVSVVMTHNADLALGLAGGGSQQGQPASGGAPLQAAQPLLQQKQRQQPLKQGTPGAAFADGTASSTLSLQVQTPGYPMVEPTKWGYPWKLVAEPHRTTQLLVSDSSVGEGDERGQFVYRVSVTLPEDGDGTLYWETMVTSLDTPAQYKFTEVSQRHSVTVVKYAAGDTSTPLAAVSEEVMVKYVRREFRALSAADRTAYFTALKRVMLEDDLDGARAELGADFANYQWLVAKHTVVCIHGGTSFLNGHLAFSLEVDRALQTMDPSLITPYWDLTLDAVTVGGEWWKSSIFSDDFFGPVDGDPVTHELMGPFKGVKNALEADMVGWVDGFGQVAQSIGANPYGIGTPATNMISSPYLQRARQWCGMEMRQPMPGCTELAACAQATGVEDLRLCLEDNVDSLRHRMAGGLWDCGMDMGKWVERYPILENYFFRLTYYVFGLFNTMVVMGAAECDDGVTIGAGCAATGTCACRCPSLDPPSMSSDAVRTAFGTAWGAFLGGDISGELGFGLDFVTYDADTGDLHFEGMAAADEEELFRDLLSLACAGARISPLNLPNASNDPIFWGLHVYVERMYDYMRIKGMDMTWDGETNTRCYGSAHQDTLPWTAALFGGEADGYLTNAELETAFDPVSDTLPYIFDNLDFSTCGF